MLVTMCVRIWFSWYEYAWFEHDSKYARVCPGLQAPMIVVECEECSMWRLVCAKQKLSKGQHRVLMSALDRMSFWCGSTLEDLDGADELKDVVFFRSLNCCEQSNCYTTLPSTSQYAFIVDKWNPLKMINPTLNVRTVKTSPLSQRNSCCFFPSVVYIIFCMCVLSVLTRLTHGMRSCVLHIFVVVYCGACGNDLCTYVQHNFVSWLPEVLKSKSAARPHAFADRGRTRN